MARPVILSGVDCRHCGSDQTCRAGIAFKSRKQRYRCRGCRKFFVENPQIRSGERTRERQFERIQRDVPSRSHLILELRKVAQELGRAPTTVDWPKLRETERVYPLYIYYAVFGGFLAAIKQAKLKPRYLQEFGEVERARMIEELRALSRRLKRPIIGKDVVAARTRGRVSPLNHFQLAFGSVPAAIAIAGVAPKATYSREELIVALRKLAAKLDRPLKLSDLDEHYRAGKGPSSRMVRRRFGGLAQAKKAARIRP
jgi:HNH endonuclease